MYGETHAEAFIRQAIRIPSGSREDHVFLKPVFDMAVLGNAARERLRE
ncbi:MAG: hypothetical protein V1793_16450 [Pseudomonadota bacterium]